MAAALLLALAVILTGYLKLGVPSGVGEDAEVARDSQRIERPVYTTRLPNGTLLTFSAVHAIPHEADDSAATLHMVEIRGRSGDGRPFSARSDTGTLRVEEGRLDLLGNVVGNGPSGERFTGSSLTIDSGTESAWSREPVRVLWGPLDLEAGAMTIQNSGAGIKAEFSNGVKLLYRAGDGGN